MQTASAAAANVGMLLRRRFSERGSPPDRASVRLASAFSRASANVSDFAVVPGPRNSIVFRDTDVRTLEDEQIGGFGLQVHRSAPRGLVRRSQRKMQACCRVHVIRTRVLQGGQQRH